MKKLPLILLLCACATAQMPGQKPVQGTPLNPGHQLSQGIVGFYLFNDNPWPLGRTYDLSGNGNNGTLAGDARSVPGPYGPALDFDGAGDWVDVSNDFWASFTTFTLVVWINLNAIDIRQDIITVWGGSSQRRFSLLAGVTSEQYSIFIGQANGGLANATGGTMVADKWTQIAATHDAIGNLVLYQNGIEVATGNGDGTLDTTNVGFRVGSNTEASPIEVDGQIDHALIYNRALSASEVGSLYAEQFQMFEQERLPIAAAAAPAGGGQVIMIMGSVPLLIVFMAFSFWISGRKAHDEVGK